jgi:hypothetical protein
MLGRNFRFSVNNQTGGNVDVVIQARFWKFNSSGALVYSSETEVFNETAIANSATAWTEDTAIDNSTDLNIGADLEVLITPAGSATGTVTVQIQRSTDGGTTWPSDGLGEQVTAHTFSASSTAVTKSVQYE